MCFLLSHVVSHPFPSARIALLRSIEHVADFSKPRMLLPVMKGLVQDPAPVAHMFGTSFEAYVLLVVAGFLSITPADLGNRDDNETWPTFVSGLRFYFRSSVFDLSFLRVRVLMRGLTDSDASVRELYANALEQRLFVDLDLERQLEVCSILLQAGSEGGEAVSICTLNIFRACSYIAPSTWHPERSSGSFLGMLP